MTERDYRKEAEKLVTACRLLENEYVEAFNNYQQAKDLDELNKCEMIARRLEKIDPDLRLQRGDTLPKFLSDQLRSSGGESKSDSQYEKFVKIAMRLLKEGKYKPL